ncbi:uncharacterized protein LOC127246490 [Andrographis paniculata]|uniref:uncharacterized protein LOC127246490 n=1 Tax=Andrographis paniculata TaxID=175694 RepID=UPI0021E828BF|nr:uncharacterized protein LOC127246490 [Andrographis paniculata]
MSVPEFNFDSLSDYHDSVNELLHSSETKLQIIQQGQQKWAHQLSEASLKMADSCAAAKDLLLLAKGHLQDLQSAFRHIAASKDDRDGSNIVASQRLPRKQLKKAILKRLQSLKGMKTTSAAAAAASPSSEEDESLAAVANLLKEVRATTVSMVDSLLPLMAMPNPDRGHRDPVFRIKLTRVDTLSFWEKCNASDIRSMMKRLEEVEMAVEDMEAELEGIFRRLIRTRASLLNILTSS